MRDLPVIDELKAILASPECAEWIMANMKHGCAPAFSDDLWFRSRLGGFLLLFNGVDRVGNVLRAAKTQGAVVTRPWTLWLASAVRAFGFVEQQGERR
jgi:hypothetical protein